MRVLLVFPPGWMQFGPYLSLPLLKAYLGARGIEVDLLDLNIEFYDWVLSRPTLEACASRLRARERRASELRPEEYAKLCKALLTSDYLSENIDAAKGVLRSRASYVDELKREQARRDICAALNVVESSYDQFRLTLNQLIFGSCGLAPRGVLPFLRSDQNIIRTFFEERVGARIARGSYDLIGFSLPAWEQLVPALTIASCLRERGERAHFCMGGNFITRLVGTWGEDPHPYTQLIDSFSVFEGEQSLWQLCEAIAKGHPLSSVENLVFARQSKLERTRIGTVNIDEIPTPDFDGLDLGSYFAPEPILPLFTSRSCPYKCSFCTIPYASSGFRERSPKLVADDLSRLTEKYRTSLYTFVDETLTVPALSGVADEIIARGLDVSWYGETRFHPKFDRDLAQRLYRSGCRKLQFGLESANQRVLNLMKKGVRVECILPNIHACLSEGIALHLFAFLGFPGETEAEARQTYAFAEEVHRLSLEEYKNPYTSMGIGSFNLEIYSDVYYHPERYGVRFDPAQARLESDELFELDYTVDRGLSRKDAARLLRELNNSGVFHDVCERTGRVWWQSLWGNETNEDQDFILYALKERKEAREDQPGPAVADLLYLKPGEGEREVRLADGVGRGAFSRDFLLTRGDESGAGSEAGPVVSFYDRSQDLVVNLPAPVGQELEAALARGALPPDPSPALRAAVEALLRNGLLIAKGSGVGVALRGEELGQHDDVQLRFNPDFAILKVRPGAIELFNLASQELVSVNAVVAWVASAVRERSVTVGELASRVAAQEPRLTEEAVAQIAASLVDARVLIAACEPRS